MSQVATSGGAVPAADTAAAPAAGGRTRMRREEHRTGWLFSAPALLLPAAFIVPHEAMGRWAVDRLLDRIDGVADPDAWPQLPVQRWSDTLETLHLCAQVVGKIRLVCGPWINHSWGVPLYVTARGLGTALVPYGGAAFEIEFDLAGSVLRVTTTGGGTATVVLGPTTIAAFHDEVLGAMRAVGMPVQINPVPSEIAAAVPFTDDTVPRAYDAGHATTLWRALVQIDRVFRDFRAGFVGKVSPVHLFWGSFDLAVTRFSGRAAPAHPGGMPNLPDDVAREAYSQEVSSLGFWPGNRQAPTPIFYSYAYPAPDGFALSAVTPDAASWLEDLGEFALPYDVVRAAGDPDATLLAFAESTYAAAADLAGWDRTVLEARGGRPSSWWRDRQRT